MNEIGNDQSGGRSDSGGTPNSSNRQLVLSSSKAVRQVLLTDPAPRESPIKIATVDDEQAVIETLSLLLEPEEKIDILGTFASPQRAIARIPALRPDIVLIDLRMPEMSGVECMERLKRRVPDLRIIVVSAYLSEDTIEEAVRAGANYFLSKPFCKSDLVSAIRYTANSPVDAPEGAWIHILFQRRRIRESKNVALTAQETNAMRLLAEGKAYKEIGAILNISESKAHKVVHNIYRKFGAHSRLEALQRWRSGFSFGCLPNEKREVGL